MFISVLGIGQGGSNIANEFAKRGFYSAAMNYSAKDLESISDVQNKLCLLGSEGVGKVRQEAIRLMSSNWDLATSFVKEHFSHPSIELILVPFATAGGSGSGATPILLDMLMELMPSKTFVAMPIIPDKTETHKSQSNCLEAFEDLSKLDISILPIDNEQTRTSMVGNGRVSLYRNTNNKVVKLIEDIFNYTNEASQYSVLDKKDLLSIFKTKGFATISEVDIAKLSPEFELTETSFAEKIQQSWDNSPFAKVEYDQIVSAGIIFDGQERLLDCLDMRKVFSIFDNEMPLNLYEGIYNQENGKIISILSGLSMCKSRLSTIESIVDSQDTSFSTNQKQSYISRIKKPEMAMPTPKKQPTTTDISNMISKFRR